MKTNPNQREIDILFVSADKNLAEDCYNCLRSGKVEEEFRIIPRYYISGKGETKPEINQNMLVVLHAVSKDEIDKIRQDWQSNFLKVNHRAFCSDDENSRNWIKDLNDNDLKLFIGKKEENLTNFRDYIRSTNLARELPKESNVGESVKEGVKNF